nr:hypothetical protein [Tanacetum cinerariifolium]
MIVTQGEGLANPTEPHHTPSPQKHQSPQSDHSRQHDSPPLSHQTIIHELIPHALHAPTKTLTPRRLTKRAIRIAQSKALSPDTDDPASLSRDDRHVEAFHTVSSLDAGQDNENIAKTSAMPHESSPRVPSLDPDEGNKIKNWDLEISRLKARVKSLEDKESRREELFQEDAPITGGIIDIGEELGADKTASVSPTDVFPTAGVPTVSGSFPTVSAIFTTASVVTPYTRRSRGITIRSLQPMRTPIISAKDKGKEKVTETEVPKKKKLQEQIDAQVAREMDEEFARENKRLSEQVARDYEIARIHVEEELKLMIEGLDRSNEFGNSGNFVPMSSKEESERVKTPGIKLDQESSKRVKISHTSRSEPSQEQQFKGSKGVFEEELKGMMQLVLLEEVYIKALQLYDTCGVHHVSTKKNQEIFMLVEKDYTLRKGLATVMIIQDEELFEASSP